jgi:threonylcarbamoyladenosine tRNA methylthiotransferase MtaB
MASHFRSIGYELVACARESDLVVINTCSVTKAAAADSRSLARRVHRQNPQADIVLTGCWSSLEPDTALRLPGVSKIVPNALKDSLVDELFDGIPPTHANPLLKKYPVPGPRLRTRAFIKVQDGCDYHCTYCVTKIARGPAHSVPLGEVLKDVHAAVSAGVKEIVLCGVSLSSYGRDLPNGVILSDLITNILKKTRIDRIRLSSIEPWAIDESLFEVFQNPRVCRQLHLPLQSGSSSTLQRMGRPISPMDFREVIEVARSRIPSLAVTTDIMVGFPGETLADFEESLQFVREMEFSGAHVFVYSTRPDTPAEELSSHIPIHEAKKRSFLMRKIIAESALEFKKRFIDEVLQVLWESTTLVMEEGIQYTGLTDNYLRVKTRSSLALVNQIQAVLIKEVVQDDLVGEILLTHD